MTWYTPEIIEKPMGEKTTMELFCGYKTNIQEYHIKGNHHYLGVAMDFKKEMIRRGTPLKAFTGYLPDLCKALNIEYDFNAKEK